MKPVRTRLHSLASFAILFLLGFGFVIYAVPASAVAPLDSNAGNSTQGNVYFHLVQVAPTPTPGGNASGYAGVSVNDQSIRIEWEITGALPAEQLQLVVHVSGPGGTTKSYALKSVQVSDKGTAGSSDYANLGQGSYSVGLSVIDPVSYKTVLASAPTTAQISIGSSETTQTTTATGSSLSYYLIPWPTYLHQEVPQGYSFKQGGALIVVSGTTLQLTTSFLGSPNTAFTNVIQIPNHNMTVGTVTTGSSGGAVFKGNVTLAPGTYQIGLLIFLSGKPDSPVAVSVPRAIQITLPLSSSTTTTSHSSTSSAHTTTSTTSTTSQSRTTTTTTYHTTSTTESEGTSRLTFTPITVSSAPQGYAYGQGAGAYATSGGNLYFSLGFTGQNPNTHYSLSLSVNGSARTIGDYTTDSKGGGHVGATTTLGTGKFVLSLTIVDLSNFSQPTAVLASIPSTFAVTTHAATSTTTSGTSHTTASTSTSTFASTTTHSETSKGHSWVFKLKPAPVPNTPAGYRFATSGTAVVTLTSPYNLLNVELGFQNGNPSTTYNAAIVLNGTSINIGTMTTNKAGAAELHGSIQVNPGNYLLGIMVFDVSNIAAFHAQGPVLVMVSDPDTQVAAILTSNNNQQENQGNNPNEGSEGQTQKSSLSSVNTQTKSATTISGGEDVQNEIQRDVDNLTIPATVQITSLQSSTNVRDSRFSLSVGQQVGNGLVIAISGENVTGPRVLLINMSKTSPLALYPALNITLDGIPVTEATTALQVLNPAATDPPRYVLIATATSIQLLVSIPHFSLHLIQVAGEIVHAVATTLAVDAPLLAGSMLVITLAFAAAYAARKRFFAVL